MNEPERFHFHAMGADCSFAVDGSVSPHIMHRAVHSALAEIQRIECKYSRFDPGSTLTRINALAAGETVAIDGETRVLLQHAGQLHRWSDGLIDVTSGALQQPVVLSHEGAQPTDPRIDTRTGARADLPPYLGWHHVRLDENGVRFDDARVQIDLGGFCKEYAADRAAQIMARCGVSSGYVDVGGDVQVLGPRANGQPWTFDIPHPEEPGGVLGSMPVYQGALATSLGHARPARAGAQPRGQRIVSMVSGQPVRYWYSVSVLAPLAVAAGVACLFTMLKEAEGLAYLQDSGLAFFALDTLGAIHTHIRR